MRSAVVARHRKVERIHRPESFQDKLQLQSITGVERKVERRTEWKKRVKQVYFWKQLWVFAAMDVVSTYGRFAEGVGGGADGDGVRKVWQS